MKTSITSILIVIFLVIAIFGTFSMVNMNENGQGCWASFFNNNVCPDNMSPLGSINFHFNAFEKLSSTIFQNTILLISLFATLFVISRIVMQYSPGLLVLSSSNFKRTDSNSKLNQNKFTRWLSLFENSPSTLN